MFARRPEGLRDITTGSFNLFVKDRNRMSHGNRETIFAA
jgi:hypothetical protein